MSPCDRAVLAERARRQRRRRRHKSMSDGQVKRSCAFAPLMRQRWRVAEFADPTGRQPDAGAQPAENRRLVQILDLLAVEADPPLLRAQARDAARRRWKAASAQRSSTGVSPKAVIRLVAAERCKAHASGRSDGSNSSWRTTSCPGRRARTGRAGKSASRSVGPLRSSLHGLRRAFGQRCVRSLVRWIPARCLGSSDSNRCLTTRVCTGTSVLPGANRHPSGTSVRMAQEPRAASQRSTFSPGARKWSETHRNGCGAGLLAASAPALATFHLMKVVEVFPGTAASPNAQYVVIQMYASGQKLRRRARDHRVQRRGHVDGTFTFPGNLANGANQAKILIATPQAEAFFGVTADLTMSAGAPVRGRQGVLGRHAGLRGLGRLHRWHRGRRHAIQCGHRAGVRQGRDPSAQYRRFGNGAGRRRRHRQQRHGFHLSACRRRATTPARSARCPRRPAAMACWRGSNNAMTTTWSTATDARARARSGRQVAHQVRATSMATASRTCCGATRPLVQMPSGGPASRRCSCRSRP